MPRPSLRLVIRGFPRPSPGRPGDPGLFGPGSAVWRINGETATILGGGRALLMQLAHPMVAAGVADHSGFEHDPFARLWGTLDAVLSVVFGDVERAREAAGRVNRTHERVIGRRGDEGYRAADPDLLLWVLSTLIDTGLVAYERFVGPLPGPIAERYYREMLRFAEPFGLPRDVAPPDVSSFRGYVSDTVCRLGVTPEARHLAEDILRPPAPLALEPAVRLMAFVTTGLLPGPIREGFGLRWSDRRQAALDGVSVAVRSAVRVSPDVVRRWPHAREAERRGVAIGSVPRQGGGGRAGPVAKRAR